jgi:hypothetical protein
MKGLMSLLIVILSVFVGGLSHAVELVGQPQVKVEAYSATILWETDVACGTRLRYGRNAAQLDQKVEGAVSSAHEVSLSGLASGTTYHYVVGSARKKLATGTFTTSGAANTSQPSIVRRALDVFTPIPKQPDTGSPADIAAPPTRQTWGNVSTLQDHFDRHGRDFSSKSPDDYAAQAWSLLQRARAESLPMKLDETDGTLRVFDPQTRAFAAYNSAGRTKTFFKPESSSYWLRQPGRPVKPADLRFSPR